MKIDLIENLHQIRDIRRIKPMCFLVCNKVHSKNNEAELLFFFVTPTMCATEPASHSVPALTAQLCCEAPLVFYSLLQRSFCCRQITAEIRGYLHSLVQAEKRLWRLSVPFRLVFWLIPQRALKVVTWLTPLILSRAVCFFLLLLVCFYASKLKSKNVCSCAASETSC